MNIRSVIKLGRLFQKNAKIRGAGFSWNHFKSLDDINEITSYLKSKLEPAGDSGTSRNVYILSNRYVLKVAKPEVAEVGIEQNKNEAQLATTPELAPIVTGVYDYHPEYLWIRSDLVRPVKDMEELISLLGLNSPTDIFTLLGPPSFKKQKLQSNPSQELLSLKEMVNSGLRDAMKSSSWGVTPDGRAVLLDYGLTSNLFQKYYSSSSDYEWPEEEDEDEDYEDENIDLGDRHTPELARTAKNRQGRS